MFFQTAKRYSRLKCWIPALNWMGCLPLWLPAEKQQMLVQLVYEICFASAIVPAHPAIAILARNFLIRVITKSNEGSQKATKNKKQTEKTRTTLAISCQERKRQISLIWCWCGTEGSGPHLQLLYLLAQGIDISSRVFIDNSLYHRNIDERLELVSNVREIDSEVFNNPQEVIEDCIHCSGWT